jgi:glutaconate CoA-transferase, subunit A
VDRERPKRGSKLASLETAIASIPLAASITMSGFGHAGHPMAAVRELLRQRKGGLHLYAVAECWPAEFLAAGGLVSSVHLSNLMLESFGRCQALNLRMERGEIRTEDHSHLSMALRLTAGAWNMPFLPIRSLAGTDIARHISFDKTKVGSAQSPFDNSSNLVVGPLHPDVAVIHASRADVYGNAQVFGTRTVIDVQVRAAKRVIITAEEIVSSEALRRSPVSTHIPGLLVADVVHAPYGAYPTGMYLYYDEDLAHLSEYHAASRTPEGTEAFLAKSIYAHASERDYMNGIGIGKLLRLRPDPALHYVPRE